MSNLSFNVPANRGLSGLLKSIFLGDRTKYSLNEDLGTRSFMEAVEEAKQNLEYVEGLFNNTSDPDIIEYAIYELYAAKLKLSYLVKQAKEKNIKSSNSMSF